MTARFPTQPSLLFLLMAIGALLGGCNAGGFGGNTPDNDRDAEPGCIDMDGDGYGEGCSLGPDCNDNEPSQTGVEICDTVDNDCDGLADESVQNACGNCDPSCRDISRGVGGDEGFDLSMDDADGVGLDAEGALILDSDRVSSDHIWIANTPEGTISKFNTETYEELARYPTGPAGRLNDPSRTSVNSRGDVYVGNRGGATVTRISTLEEGCPDTNGDGMVTTSGAGTEVLAWGQDDCVLWNTDLGNFAEARGRRIRALAAQDIEGPDGELLEYVWVGAWDDDRIFKLDGRTGDVLLYTESPVQPYGFALDEAGNLWISTREGNRLGRLDTNRCVDNASCMVSACTGEGACDDAIKQIVNVPITPYGITVDFNQRVWLGGENIVRYDPMAPSGSRNRVVSLPFGGRGIAIHGIAADAMGFVWGAGQDNGIVRVDANSLAYHVVSGSQGYRNKGMAVDAAGKIWSITRENRAVVITPGAGLMDNPINPEVARSIVTPYTYSDMTGAQLRLATNPRGYYRRVYEACEGEMTGGVRWSHLVWDAEVPAGTRLTFRIRTGASREALAAAEWVGVAGVPSDTSPISIEDALTAAGVTTERFLELEVVLQAERRSTTEIISPRLRRIGVGFFCDPGIV